MGSTGNPPPASVSLAPFAFDWVGGDIHGLQMLAIQLHGYVPATTDVTTALDRRAGQLTSDDPGGWQGSAASAFAASWSRDALAGGALAAVIGQVSEITGGLAVALSEIENALETQADTAARHGVQIMPDGQPGPQPEGPPASTAEAAQQQWAASYQQVWQRARAEAGQVRQQAAAQLAGIYQQIAPPHKRSPGGISASEDITVSELLADLWAVPTASRREVNELIERLEGRAGALERELAAERGAGRPFSAGVKDELAKTNAELDAAGQELRNAGRTENALSKLLDSRIRNVRDYLAGQAGPGEHVAGRTPEALADAADQDPGLLGQLIDAGERIPMVDVVAGAAGTALGTYTDVKAGKPLDEALPKEAAANVVGLVAGAVVGGAIGGIPGALVGSVVGYGVGDLTHNLLWEPWGQDMHTYGAVGGVLYGAGHSEFATVDDTRGFAVSAGHTAEHLWDSIF
jgi:hypothetical protein